MLKKTSRYSSQSGQAMIEFLPAILLFFVIIGTSIVFFIGLRESFHMQLAARHSLFGKIRNSGPLVVPSNSSIATNDGFYPLPATVSRNAGMSVRSTCLSARPQTGVRQAVLPSILGLSLNLERAHRATIFRRPGSITSCD